MKTEGCLRGKASTETYEIQPCQPSGHIAEDKGARFLLSLATRNQSLVPKEKAALISAPKNQQPLRA